MRSNTIFQSRALRRTALAAAMAATLASGVVFAQSTTGSLFGQAPVAEGETVQLTSASGVTRVTPVDQSGRYSFRALPLGDYKVDLLRNGAVVDTRDNVSLTVNAGTEVSFVNRAATASDASNLEAVTVTGNALPAIDVSSVDSRSVINQKQLQQLPIGRNSESIALLAPGTSAGATGTGFASPTGQALVSFAGSSISENAYYVNGMNTTDPISGYGGITLPYGAIDQQETLTGGYSAMYGRSDGGVINIIGRRGSNDWHFGAQLLYTPLWGKGDPKNTYYANDSANAGDMYRRRDENKVWESVVSAYAGGPLIKDKLFGFVAVEAAKQQGTTISSVASGQQTNYSYKDPKVYAKLDWNINDNNLLEVTGATDKHDYEGSVYNYDYGNQQKGEFLNTDTATKVSQKMWIAKFTSYITDDLTLTAQYGRQKTEFYNQPADADPNLIHIFSSGLQDPSLNGGVAGGYHNALSIGTLTDPAKESKGTNYRLDLTYRLGDHQLSAGIDNQSTQDNNDGDSIFSNSGFGWEYGTVTPGVPIEGGQVQTPASGFYVDKYRYTTAASVGVKQRAQYVEDRWQVNDNLLLSLGLRNDQFTNYNGNGQPYITQHKPQWAPRLGASWDVFGDSTFKVYGNAGRYYLALPTAPALRGASGSYFTHAYYSYTGIDPTTGYPLGLQPLPTSKGPEGEFSANNEFGIAPNPKTVTAKGIDPEYQDEFIVGFDKTIGQDWVYGAKITYRNLRNAIDDFCDIPRVTAKSAALGNDVDSERFDLVSCYLFNPGRANDFQVENGTGGLDTIPLTNNELGFPKLKRKYIAVDLHLEHPNDGKWWGRVDYIFSRNFGNSEGQVDSDAGTRSQPSVTQNWDSAEFMEYASGRLPNDHTHTLKAFGSYQFTPEFMVAGNLLIQSGAPRNCYGAYGAGQTEPVDGYGNESYHYCGGLPSPPGKAGSNPVTHIVSLTGEYRPAFADHKLAFSVEVNNIFNEQKKTQSSPYYGVSTAPDPDYNLPIAYETPRYVRFGVTYDY